MAGPQTSKSMLDKTSIPAGSQHKTAMGGEPRPPTS